MSEYHLSGTEGNHSQPAKSKVAIMGPQNGRWGFWMLPSTFAEYIVLFVHYFHVKKIKEIVATNVIASLLPKRQLPATPTTQSNVVKNGVEIRCV